MQALTQSKERIRLAYLVTHPIQYQAPLLRRVAAMPEVELHVFFQSRMGAEPYLDRGFGQRIEWDIPLLDGYEHTFLTPMFGASNQIDTWRPFSKGLLKELRSGRFDALWIHGYSRPLSIFAAFVSRARGLAVLVRDDVHGLNQDEPGLRGYVKRALLTSMSFFGFHFLAIGSANRRFYTTFGVKDADITLMPYAVDNEWFQQRISESIPAIPSLKAALGIDDFSPVILYAGKFLTWKRAEDLLTAYKAVASEAATKQTAAPWLLYAGSGPTLAAIQGQAKEFPRVKFLGFQNQKQLAALFGLCDIFVLPSSKEPWGLVVNEVMNAGKAVIVTDKCGCAEDLINHGKNGYVYKAEDVNDLAGCLSRLCDDPDLRKHMGAESLNKINKWGFEADVSALLGAISKALSSSSVRRRARLEMTALNSG